MIPIMQVQEFILRIYLKVKILGHTIYIYTDQLQEIMPNCFPKRSYHILLPAALYEHFYGSIFFSTPGIFRHVNILQTK